MQTRTPPEKFLVAFSLAGEARELVRSIAEAVERQLGPDTVFYYEWFEHWLGGAGSGSRWPLLAADALRPVLADGRPQRCARGFWRIADRQRRLALSADPRCQRDRQ